MIRIRANVMLALSATLASALLLTAAQGATAASASGMPPPNALPGEGSWQSTDDVHTQDSIAVADDATTASVISMWRSNTPGDNSIAWQVVQNNRVYPIQGAAAVGESARECGRPVRESPGRAVARNGARSGGSPSANHALTVPGPDSHPRGMQGYGKA